MKEVLIIGGGISGLTLAYFLNKLSPSSSLHITIIEKAPQVGGWVHSTSNNEEKKRNDGFYTFEKGPRSIRVDKHSPLIEIIEDLSLEDEVLLPSSTAKAGFLLDEGLKINKAIPTWTSIARIFYAALWEGITYGRVCEDEDIEHFIRRRLGDYVFEHLVAPMVRGIYGGEASTLSIRSCFPSLYQAEQSNGSLVRHFILHPFSSFNRNSPPHYSSTKSSSPLQTLKKVTGISFKGGLQTLLVKIADSLDASILLESSVQSIRAHGEGYKVKYSTKDKEEEGIFDYVFSAVPAKDLAPLVASMSPQLSESLLQIQYATLTVVNYRFSSASFKQKVQKSYSGFGYLIPPRLNVPVVMGVSFDSLIYPDAAPNANDVVLTAMLAGAQSEEIAKEIGLRHLQATLGDALGEQLIPTDVAAKICKDGLPQYRVGHWRILENIENALQEDVFRGKFFVIGNNYRGVGCSDCVKNAFECAAKFSKGL